MVEAQKNLTLRHRSSFCYKLIIYDAYRPKKSVDYFLEWRDISANDTAAIKSAYYPDYEKEELFDLGFIAPGNSGHTRGSTLDVAIFDQNTGRQLDFGTPFDYFGEKSHTAHVNIREHVQKKSEE